jgi:purine-nucleoside phosphorylase
MVTMGVLSGMAADVTRSVASYWHSAKGLRNHALTICSLRSRSLTTEEDSEWMARHATINAMQQILDVAAILYLRPDC